MTNKPIIPEVVARFARYNEQPGNGAWGSLHVVLDDGNTQDLHVTGCIEYAHEHDDMEGEELAKLLLRMSRTQRAKLPHAVWEFQKRASERRGASETQDLKT